MATTLPSADLYSRQQIDSALDALNARLQEMVQGPGYVGAAIDGDGHLVLTRTDGTLEDVGPIQATDFQPFPSTSRPNAATVGVGRPCYDTTLSKPIWSDGTQWRDATGTVV